MTKLTVIQAARTGYAGRSTIYRKLEAGELNSETDESGTIVIDPAELDRIFGEPAAHGGPSRETSRNRSETERLRAENALLRAENEDLRRHRDRLMALLEQTTLPAPTPKPGRTLRGVLGRALPAHRTQT